MHRQWSGAATRGPSLSAGRRRHLEIQRQCMRNTRAELCRRPSRPNRDGCKQVVVIGSSTSIGTSMAYKQWCLQPLSSIWQTATGCRFRRSSRTRLIRTTCFAKWYLCYSLAVARTSQRNKALSSRRCAGHCWDVCINFWVGGRVLRGI